jgi:hypothetical protein
MYATALVARAPQHRFPAANDWGVPVVPTNFQPNGPCSPGGDCCDDCSQAPAAYLSRDIEARPRIPSAFRRGMQGLGVSTNAYLSPFVKGDWGPSYAARQLPGVAPEDWRPEGFHGLGAANIAIRAADARIIDASNLLARTPFGNPALNASGLHRYQVLSSAAHALQMLTIGAFDRSVVNDYMNSVCGVDDAGNILPGTGDTARARAVVSTVIGAIAAGASALQDALGGSVLTAATQALNLIKNELGELENERRQYCENVSAERRGGGVDTTVLAREYFTRNPARFPLVVKSETAGMSTGVKVAIGAAALGVFGALVYAIAK